MPDRSLPTQSAGYVDDSRNDDPKHLALVTAIAEKRGCIGPFPCGRGIPEFGGRDAACDCEAAAIERESYRPVMGNGGPCISCDGNDGYGPAPHHAPDCYFASQEDADAA